MFGVDDVVGEVLKLDSANINAEAQKKMKEWEVASADRKAEIERELAQQGIDINKEQQAAREQAYKDRMASAGSIGAAGENAFNTAVSTPLPELEQAKKDVLSGQAAGMQVAAGQMSANLANSGVRGGQAAGLLNEGTGKMGIQATKDINTMQLSEAEQRAAEQRAYEAAKAARAQGAQVGASGL